MSTINDLIQLADTLQRRKVEDRRYQDQRNMQLAQIAEAKNKENQVIQGQRYFNEMTSGLMKSGWDDEGKWTGEAPDTNKLVETYLDNMNNLGLVGDSALALERVGQFNQLRLQKAGMQLQSKFANWSANNPDAKPEDKAAYLSSINADKLYSQLYGLGGPVAATELTGISPDVFGVKSNKMSGLEKGGLGAAAVLGSAWVGNKILNTMGDSIARGEALITSKGEGKALVAKLQKELRILKKGGTKEQIAQAAKMEKWLTAVNKRGYIDEASHTVLKREAAKLPSLDTAEVKAKLKDARKSLKGIKSPTTTSQILKKISKFSPGQLVKTIGGGIGSGYLGAKAVESLGGGEIAQTAGAITVPALASKLVKPSNLNKLIPAIKKVAPKLAQKLAISAGAIVAPEAISTGLGIAGMAMMLNDIIKYMDNPEVADVIASFE